MNDTRWVNPSQPQTLYLATILCYVDAVFGLLPLLLGGGSPEGLLIAAALGAGGFGIANEKKWGYAAALVGAILQLGLLLLFFGVEVLGFPIIITFMFDAALVALLVHPMSRDYQRIWFR